MEIRSNNKAKHRSQRLAFGIFRLLSLCIVLILFAILGFIIYKGAGAISWEFITSAPTDGMTGGGIWPAIVGTFYLMVGSALFAFPVGVMSGIYMNEYAPKGKLVRFGYVEVTAREDTPFLPAGQSIRAHEFHYWDTNDNGDMFQAVKASGKGHWPCMRQEQQILAGFPHLYYGSNPELAGNFVKGCFQWQERCAGKQVAECYRKMLTGMVGCVGAMVLEGQADESLEGQQTER